MFSCFGLQVGERLVNQRSKVFRKIGPSFGPLLVLRFKLRFSTSSFDSLVQIVPAGILLPHHTRRGFRLGVDEMRSVHGLSVGPGATGVSAPRSICSLQLRPQNGASNHHKTTAHRMAPVALPVSLPLGVFRPILPTTPSVMVLMLATAIGQGCSDQYGSSDHRLQRLLL